MLVLGARLAPVMIVLAVLAGSAGCTATASTSAPPDPLPSDGGSGTIPKMILGPQGVGGQFVVKCGYSHSLMDDPIVHPDHGGASHRHDFFGNTATKASSTAASLAGGDTTCNRRLDTAAYWSPSLLDHGEPVTPLGSVAYYRPAPGADPVTLVPYPTGLVMVAGDAKATDAQPPQVAAWTCGTSSALRPTPPICDPATPLHVKITFPDCWNGQDLDATDHRSHVVYRTDGACPADHPVAFPQLTFEVRYPISGPDHDLTLASGATAGAHADFLNAWDQAELTDQVERCLHRAVVCSVASNRADDVATSSTP